jgi:acid phosphatase family membrane protein YuiD
MTRPEVSGEQASLFNEMTRQTIMRYVNDMNQEQLLDLLGHLILTRRNG